MPRLHQRHCLLSLILPSSFSHFKGGLYTRDKSHGYFTFPAHYMSSFPSSWVNKLKIVKPHKLNHLTNSTKWNLSFRQKYDIWASVHYCGSKSSLCRGSSQTSAIPTQNNHGWVGGMVRPASSAILDFRELFVLASTSSSMLDNMALTDPLISLALTFNFFPLLFLLFHIPFKFYWSFLPS